MLYLLGVLIAIGAGVVFAVMGALTLWGGLDTMRTEVPRDHLRSQADGGTRALTAVLVGLPLLITGLFGLLAALRLIQVAFGL
ncbi:MAG TPA: hypothetical protein PKD53_05895 [Chloroflexaceae bacterium]|nr:hypothetical protein [Chloroflexaceae bacterium]